MPYCLYYLHLQQQHLSLLFQSNLLPVYYTRLWLYLSHTTTRLLSKKKKVNTPSVLLPGDIQRKASGRTILKPKGGCPKIRFLLIQWRQEYVLRTKGLIIPKWPRMPSTAHALHQMHNQNPVSSWATCGVLYRFAMASI